MNRIAAGALKAIVLAAALWPIYGGAGEPSSKLPSTDTFYGNYRVHKGHFIGIDRYITDEGDDAILISDYQSGVVRRLFRVSDTEFEMGPGFAVQSPAELRVRFDRDGRGGVSGVRLQPTGGTETIAARTPIREIAVEIPNGTVRLSATLMLPDGGGRHPAIILLHGSGPLTRYSFGPYPHFFTSLGFAVLIYDKRGTGASTGTLLDSSTAVPTPRPDESYPDRLASDAHAAIRFLRNRPEIDSGKIGLWGSSEGGMLTTQVAAKDKRIAFAINSSGFMGPLWETTLYQSGLSLRQSGFTEEQISAVKDATRRWLDAARTGKGFDEVMKQRDEALREKRGWLVGWTRLDIRSREQLQWYWDHVQSFSPLPALADVKCPVLGVFGEKDTSTDAAVAANNMRRVLSEAGNSDFSVKVFPNAGHSLAEMPDGSRMAPGVFQTLRTWLLDRIRMQ